MATHRIPDKVKAQIDRMYDGANKKRVIEALESGKTVYKGKVKLRGVQVDKDEGSTARAPPPPPNNQKPPPTRGPEK